MLRPTSEKPSRHLYTAFMPCVVLGAMTSPFLGRSGRCLQRSVCCPGDAIRRRTSGELTQIPDASGMQSKSQHVSRFVSGKTICQSFLPLVLTIDPRAHRDTVFLATQFPRLLTCNFLNCGRWRKWSDGGTRKRGPCLLKRRIKGHEPGPQTGM